MDVTDSAPENKLDLVFAFQQELCGHLQLVVPFMTGANGATDVEAWVAAVDARCEVHQLRHYLLTHAVAAEILGALISRFLALQEPSSADRSKIDLLLVHYLAQTISSEQADLTLDSAAKLLEPILGVTTPAPVSALVTLAKELDTAASLGDLLGRKVLERMQSVRSDQHDYTRTSMVIFAWMGLRARRTCVRLVLAAINSIERNLGHLKQLGITKFPMREADPDHDVTIGELFNRCRTWKHPFAGKYSDESWLTQIADLHAVTECAVQVTAGTLGQAPNGVLERVSVVNSPIPKQEPLQATENSSPLHTWVAEIQSGIEAVHSEDFARVQVGQVSIILSSAEIRAFRSKDGSVSLLVRNMAASRALLSSAAKTSDHEQFENAKIIAADLLAAAREAIMVAEGSNKSELAIDLRGCTRTLEKALAR